MTWMGLDLDGGMARGRLPHFFAACFVFVSTRYRMDTGQRFPLVFASGLVHTRRRYERKIVTRLQQDAPWRAEDVPFCHFAVWLCAPALYVSDYGHQDGHGFIESSVESRVRGPVQPQYLYRLPGLRQGISLRLAADEGGRGGQQRSLVGRAAKNRLRHPFPLLSSYVLPDRSQNRSGRVAHSSPLLA